MTDRNAHEEAELLDETRQVLHTLNQLIQATSNPIVKVCLEEAHEDIAHLMSTGEESQERTNAA